MIGDRTEFVKQKIRFSLIIITYSTEVQKQIQKLHFCIFNKNPQNSEITDRSTTLIFKNALHLLLNCVIHPMFPSRNKNKKKVQINALIIM